MKPLIKWPGGKTSELSQFTWLIPDHDRYIEPFVGGGALFFYLNPENALINDNSEDLMLFYELVKDQDAAFNRILNLYARSFSALQEECERCYLDLHTLYRLFLFAQENGLDLVRLNVHKELVRRIAMSMEDLGELVPDEEAYLVQMEKAVLDKILRTVKIDQKRPMSEKDLMANLVTGFTGGYYLYFRDVFNQLASGRMIGSKQYRAANFYFIREYCYGSMFRYNAAGEFNIPYGGISYNKKDFAGKVARIFDRDTAALLDRTQLFCEDFEEMLNGLDLTERDFLFLDPPYDTEFSDYEGRSFTREDQKRLASFLERTPARFLLVIKNTDFIYSLYEGKFRILAFENKYLYNVRSRNERKSEHLLVTNMPELEVPWIRENINLQGNDYA